MRIATNLNSCFQASLRRFSVLIIVLVILTQLVLPAVANASVEASLDDSADAESIDTTANAQYLPAIKLQPTACWESSEPSIYGIQIYGASGSESKYHTAMLGTGIDWVRIPVKWSVVETEEYDPSVYDWSVADRAVQVALEGQGCKRIILTHQSAPTWAAKFFAESAIATDKLDAFADYMTALAERYDGDGVDDADGSPVVNYFEMYNEPDASVANYGHSGWGEAVGVDLDHQDYVDMLNIAHGAIKSANPKAKILLGGIAHDWFAPDDEHPDREGYFVEGFLYDVLELGGGKYFDIFNVHVYPSFADTWIPQVDPGCTVTGSCVGPGLLEKIAVMRKVLVDYGLSDKPIFITESGWYSEAAIDIPSNETVHARYVVELSVQAKASDVEVMILFSLVDPDLTLHKYGLVTSTGRQKLAYDAYVEIIQRLGYATYSRKLDDSETSDEFMEAYEFVDEDIGSTFVVAWRNPAEMGEDLDSDGEPDTKYIATTLALTANRAEVYDMYGSLIETVEGTQGTVSIDIGADPQYIVLAQ